MYYFPVKEEDDDDGSLAHCRNGKMGRSEVCNGKWQSIIDYLIRYTAILSNCAADQLRKYTRHSDLPHLRSLSFGQLPIVISLYQGKR